MNNLVSVIIPTYNRSHLISETLDSIKSQIYQNWECLVIDDGSTDDTESVVRRYVAADSRFVYHKRPLDVKKGAPSCRNLGFKLSKGSFIQWFDSDDIMFPSMLLEKYKSFKDPNVDFVVSKMAEFTEPGKLIYPSYETRSENMINDYLLYKIFFLTPGPLFKRVFLERQRLLFDTELVRHQEWEFYSRLLLLGGKGCFLNEYHCARRMHQDSIKSLTSQLTDQTKQKNKFNSILALNRNTDFKYQNIIRTLFFKRISKEIVRSFIKLDIKHINYFSSVLFNLIKIRK